MAQRLHYVPTLAAADLSLEDLVSAKSVLSFSLAFLKLTSFRLLLRRMATSLSGFQQLGIIEGHGHGWLSDPMGFHFNAS